LKNGLNGDIMMQGRESLCNTPGMLL